MRQSRPAIDFGRALAPGGYAWWYIDALSEDGIHALTLIAFIGSVFSPYYAAARRRSAAVDPALHVALNVSLYGSDRKLWAMTERGRNQLQAHANELVIGPSALRFNGDCLSIDIDEITVPWPRRLRGTVRLYPQFWLEEEHALDRLRQHHWRPIAPRCAVEVEMTQPALRWRGQAYLDSNFGGRPLEQDFEHWQWARADLSGGRSAVLYDVACRDGGGTALALAFDRDGRSTRIEAPPPVVLPRTRWQLQRKGRSDAPIDVCRTLEDGPFYARSLLSATWLDEPVTAWHETLDLRRFASRAVQAMLPFRMPRRAG